jgi:hypothetical protein
MTNNSFYFEGKENEYKAYYTAEEVQEWERVCKERNINPDITKLSAIKEFMYDTLIRLKIIEDKINN